MADELLERYHTDPVFHAVTNIVSQIFHNGGYADDDGVWINGPTRGDADSVARLMTQLEANGLRITDR